jgi:hypothetical protein
MGQSEQMEDHPKDPSAASKSVKPVSLKKSSKLSYASKVPSDYKSIKEGLDGLVNKGGGGDEDDVSELMEFDAASGDQLAA